MTDRGPARETEEQKRKRARDTRKRNARNGAMYRVFMNKDPSDQDALLVQEIMQEICKVNEPTAATGLDALVAIVKNEGKREVYSRISVAISAGGRLRDSEGWVGTHNSGRDDG